MAREASQRRRTAWHNHEGFTDGGGTGRRYGRRKILRWISPDPRREAEDGALPVGNQCRRRGTEGAEMGLGRLGSVIEDSSDREGGGSVHGSRDEGGVATRLCLARMMAAEVAQGGGEEGRSLEIWPGGGSEEVADVGNGLPETKGDGRWQIGTLPEVAVVV